MHASAKHGAVVVFAEALTSICTHRHNPALTEHFVFITHECSTSRDPGLQSLVSVPASAFPAVLHCTASYRDILCRTAIYRVVLKYTASYCGIRRRTEIYSTVVYCPSPASP